MGFNKTKPSTKTTNFAGGDARSVNAETELYFAVASTFTKDAFYESSDKRLERIQYLVSKCDDKFVAQLAIWNRTKGNMRSSSVTLLGELFKKGSKYARMATIESVQRPDDLTELVAYVGGITAQMKRAVRRCLFKFDRYQLSKYQMKSRGVSLVDLFNLVHPNPKFATDEQKEAWKDLIEGNLKVEGTVEKILSASKEDSEDRAENLEKLVREKKMGYMAMLRNLNKMSGLSVEAKTMVCEYISNPTAVRNSKQLPFRFISAMDEVSDKDFLGAIEKALEISCENIPKIDGKTLVALDISGSMSGLPIKVGSVIAAALAKSNNADVIAFDTSVKEHKIIPGTPLLAIVNQIRADGGGTETGLVFQYAQKKYDTIFVVSDNESWVSSAQYTYRTYSQGVKTYCIDVNGYGTVDIVGNSVFHISGWSNSMFEFITTGVDTVISEIKSLMLE